MEASGSFELAHVFALSQKCRKQKGSSASSVPGIRWDPHWCQQPISVIPSLKFNHVGKNGTALALTALSVSEPERIQCQSQCQICRAAPFLLVSAHVIKFQQFLQFLQEWSRSGTDSGTDSALTQSDLPRPLLLASPLHLRIPGTAPGGMVLGVRVLWVPAVPSMVPPVWCTVPAVPGSGKWLR